MNASHAQGHGSAAGRAGDTRSDERTGCVVEISVLAPDGTFAQKEHRACAGTDAPALATFTVPLSALRALVRGTLKVPAESVCLLTRISLWGPKVSWARHVTIFKSAIGTSSQSHRNLIAMTRMDDGPP